MSHRSIHAARATFVTACLVLAVIDQSARNVNAQSPVASPASAESLKIAFHRDDGSLTPYSFEYGYPLMTLVYDTLMWRDKQGQPQTWLASSLEANDDFTRFTAKLADARWHDGKPVSSADVAFSFRLFKARYHPRFTPQLEPIERVETPDSKTVIFRLRVSRPGFSDLPLSDIPILPRHAWGSVGERSLPPGRALGSGPYRMASYEMGKGYRFEAHDDYFRGPPKVRVLEVIVIDTTEMRLQAIERRQIDMTPAAFPRTAANRVRDLGTQIIEGPAFAPTMLVLNTRRPPFDDANARRAVSIAIDVDKVKGAVGRAVAATAGLMHPASEWAPGERVHRSEVAQARELLRRLALPKIEILAPSNDLVQLEAGEQAALALKRAGAEAEMVRSREGEVVDAIGKTGKDPTFTAAIWTGHNLSSYEPSFLGSMFGQLGPSNPFSFSGFASDELEVLFDRAAATVSEDERKQRVLEALSYLEEQAPVIPLVFSNGVYAYRSSFPGWVYVKGTGILDKRSFVEPESRLVSEESDPVAPERRRGLSPFRLAAIAVAAIALALLAFQLMSQRKVNSG